MARWLKTSRDSVDSLQAEDSSTIDYGSDTLLLASPGRDTQANDNKNTSNFDLVLTNLSGQQRAIIQVMI